MGFKYKYKYKIQNFKRAEVRVQRGLALWQGSEPGWHKKGKG